MPLFTDQTIRACSRCGQELTDPASRECGVGPICRQKDNHLYAKTIQANLPGASAIILGTTADQFPAEVRDTWTKLTEYFLRQMTRSQQQTDLMFTGADFRETVRSIDWMLSFKMSHTLKSRLVKVVGYLGYPGLAGVLAGEASTTAARIWFDTGRVFLEGKSNRHGFAAMRRIPGVTTPRYRGDRTPYSAPASQAPAFLEVVATYWPMYEGDMEAIRTQAAASAATAPAVPSAPVGPIATIQKRSDDVIVKFDWVRGAPMYDLINAIKAIPSLDRKYDPAAKVWTVKTSHMPAVLEALKLVFEPGQIRVETTDAPTPAGLYDARPRLTTRRASQYFGGYGWRRY